MLLTSQRYGILHFFIIAFFKIWYNIGVENFKSKTMDNDQNKNEDDKILDSELH